MASVELRNVVKNYGKNEVLHNVSAHFADGRFVVIVGPSGCGKSTLLRIIAGLETVSEGEVRIMDEVVNDIEPKDRKIAMVFQNYALYPHMSVFNNMAYGLRLRKHSKKEIQRRVLEAATMLQLEELLSRKPRQLSGGQRQRVAMGRALVRNPEVFLFDEPLSNLDAKLRHLMRAELKRLHRELRTTMIFVTHDQVEAMTLADIIVVLNEGNIEQIGTPDEIYGRPVSTFVAGFIGSPPMNFIEGQVEGSRLFFPGGASIKLQKVNLGTGRITVGIRPERILPARKESDTLLECDIDFIERLGAGQLIYCHTEGQPVVISAHNGFTLAGKDRYRATFCEEDLHFFDVHNRRRVG